MICNIPRSLYLNLQVHTLPTLYDRYTYMFTRITDTVTNLYSREMTDVFPVPVKI